MGEYSEYRQKGLRGAAGIANSIIFTRSYPGKQLLSFLLVEGTTDKSVFKRYVNIQKCQITVAYGKENVIDTIAILEQESFPGVLAIVDADFTVLAGMTPTTPNVLFTDAHDMETMIIQSPALEKVLDEFGSEDKIAELVKTSGKEVRRILIEASLPIGYLRWISLLDGLSLTFEGLDFNKFVAKETLFIDTLKLIKNVKDKSHKPALAEMQLHSRLQEIKDDTHKLWHVCCGHDLVHVLSIGLCKAMGTCNTNDVRPEVLERSLRLAYEQAHFQNTQLYLSIQHWEKANRPFVILSSN